MRNGLLKFFSIVVLFFIVSGQASVFLKGEESILKKLFPEPISQEKTKELAQRLVKYGKEAFTVCECCSKFEESVKILECCSKLECWGAAEVLEYCSKLKDGKKVQKGASEQGGEGQEIVKQDDDKYAKKRDPS